MNIKTGFARFAGSAAFLLFGLFSVLDSQPVHAANGQCKWEGGPGKSNPAYAYCEAEDCTGNGGLAQCSKGVGAGGSNESVLGPDKWVFGACDQQGSYVIIWRRWCVAAGGEWNIDIPGSPGCVNMPAGVIGSGGSTTNNEAQIIQIADAFAKETASCASMSSDTGWGTTIGSGSLCWSGSQMENLGVLTRSLRRRIYTSGNSCAGSLTIDFLKDRGAKCPAGYKSRNATTGPECYLPAECCLKVSNPVSPLSGTKFQEEFDYQGAPIGGLELRRYYKSTGYYRPSNLTTNIPNPETMLASEFWRNSYDRRLYFVTGNSEVRAIQQRADGSIRSFAPNGRELGNIDGGAARLEEVSGIGWDLTLANHDVERYNTTGQLISLTTRAGIVTTMFYDGCGLLSTVVGAFGHTLTFTNDCGKRRATSVTLPDSTQITYEYDSFDRPTTVSYPDGSARTYLYGDARNQWLLTGIEDESGQLFANYEYDDSGRAILSEHGDHANRYQFTYGSTATTVVDPLGATTQYGFSSSGGAFRNASYSQACRDCGNLKSATYDANGNRATLTDFNQVQTVFAHDLLRNLETSRTEAAGTPRARVITTQWHSTYRLPTQVERPGQRTDFSYSANGNLETRTVTDLATGTTRAWAYTYDSVGRVLTADGPRTDAVDVTTYTYYSCSSGSQCGQVHTIENALGQTTTFNTYDAHGRPLTVTDANGIVTTFTYDLRQRITSRVSAGEQTTFEYWPTGLLKKTALPDASFLSYSYDSAHRLKRVADSAGNYVSYLLDGAGNQTMEEAYDPSGALASRRKQFFNSLDRLWKQMGATGSAAVTTVFSYDSNGNQTAVDAPLARTTLNQFDELNRLKQVTDPGQGVTEYAYDELDNLTSVTDPSNHVTGYLYNAFGDLRQISSPDTGVTANTFDSGGNLKTSTDARSKTATYAYDALNRVTSVAYPDLTTTFTYDNGPNGNGRLSGASDANHAMTWSYDALGRVVGKTQAVGAVSRSVGYGYSDGHLTTLTLPSGRVITYDYTNNRVSGIAVDGIAVLSDVGYEPFGPIAGWIWGNGTTTTRDYDLDGKPIAIQSAGTSSYSYDDAFRITAIADLDSSTRSWIYGYDSLDRVTSAARTGFIQGWTYDANGNRLAETGAAPSTYTIAAGSNRLSGVSGNLSRTYMYATSGQIAGDGAHTFTYNDAGRLTGVSGATSATYIYNALGQRVKKVAAGVTTHFVYDEAGHLIGEYDATGSLIQEIVWLDDTPVATLRDCSCGSSIFYIHTDHLNTPRKITKRSTSDVVWRWDSDPFGTTLANSDPDGDGTEFSFGLRFPGQYYDEETGQHYNYYRDYDPTTGRYVQSDPIGLKGGLNTYSYVGSAPTMFFDEYGLEPKSGGPWHPPDGVSLSCKRSDTCPQLEAKMSQLLRMIASHTGWDHKLPKPRGGNRHADEIADLWRAYGNCQQIHNFKCKSQCPAPPSDGLSELGMGAALGVGIGCALAPEICLPGLLIGGAAVGATQ